MKSHSVPSKSGFGLNWEYDEQASLNLARENKFKLEYFRENEINFDSAKPTHYLIEGDNLPVLHLLQNQYKGKVDLIYIDPPYNTGFKQDQEGFQYHDQRREQHHKYRHSAWLNFMYPRIEQARELLNEEGLIFISIDENEFAHLKLLCDEIFDEKNFLNYLVWKKRSTGGQIRSGSIISQTEFVLIYAKNKSKASLNKIENPNVGNVKWRDFRKSGGQWQRKYRPKQYFPFYYIIEQDKLLLEKPSQSHLEVYPQDSKGQEGFWENGIETTSQRLANGELKVAKSKQGYYKILQKEVASATQNAGNFIDIPSVQGSHEIKRFDLHFNNVKPLALLEFILELGSKTDALVVDFFAGSGSTGHAVLKMNAERLHRRKFILCTNNEYNLCEEVTYPRIKRCLEGYTNKEGKVLIGFGESLKYQRLTSI